MAEKRAALRMRRLRHPLDPFRDVRRNLLHDRAGGRVAVLMRIERPVKAEIADRGPRAEEEFVFREMRVEFGEKPLIALFDGRARRLGHAEKGKRAREGLRRFLA